MRMSEDEVVGQSWGMGGCIIDEFKSKHFDNTALASISEHRVAAQG